MLWLLKQCLQFMLGAQCVTIEWMDEGRLLNMKFFVVLGIWTTKFTNHLAFYLVVNYFKKY